MRLSKIKKSIRDDFKLTVKDYAHENGLSTSDVRQFICENGFKDWRELKNIVKAQTIKTLILDGKSLPTISRETGLHDKSISRFFHQHYGYSVKEYQERIAHVSNVSEDKEGNN